MTILAFILDWGGKNKGGYFGVLRDKQVPIRFKEKV